MSPAPPPVLIVATILEGRQFPAKLKSQLLVTCKFAGELLNSDPVPHTSAPYFNTELAWEMTRKNLHQHRLQRTPLKLTFTCVTGSTREEVGHVMLDLRSIAPGNEEYKWYSLARSKYKTHKPQIRLLLAIEEESQQPPPPVESGPPKLLVSLDPGSGCYQVGDPSSSDSLFNMSLTIIAAANLSLLINTEIPGAFCFRFNLLDNVITNSSFPNAVKPEFPLERVSVKMRGTLTSIYRYLATVKDVSLQLCQGGETIGVTGIALSKLLTAPSDDENINSLHTCLTLRHPKEEDVIAEDQPMVEVHFTLREEEEARDPESRDDQPVKPSDVSAEPDTEELLAPSTDNMEGVRQTLSFDSPAKEPVKMKPVRQPKPAEKQPKPAEKQPKPAVKQPEPEPEPVRLVEEERRPAVVEEGPRPVAGETNNSWLCCLRLASAKLNRSGKKYVRYVYPFFGSSAPQSTAVVKVMAGETTLLPPSTCEYSFLADRTAITEQFTKVPLILQIWSKGPDGDNIEGTAVVLLAPLLQPGLHSLSGKVVSKEDEKTMGEIHVSGWLECKGSVNLPPSAQPAMPPQPLVAERQRSDYKTALELELWKEMEQEKFIREMEEQSEARLKQISAEWKRKEAEREEEGRRQIAEYTKLKDKMRIALRDLEIRENKLLEEERKLSLAQEDLAREQTRLTAELREASRRSEEEFNHKLALQKRKLAALETQNADLKLRIEEAERTLERRTGELAVAREAALSAPSTAAQTQLEVMRMERAELERRAASLEKAKMHYKESWTKALKELINVREKAQQEAKRRLLQEQTLMEHARLRYLEESKLKEKTPATEPVKETAPAVDENRQPENNITLGRLIDERDTLLRTGVYSKEDAVIVELNSKIKSIQCTT